MSLNAMNRVFSNLDQPKKNKNIFMFGKPLLFFESIFCLNVLQVTEKGIIVSSLMCGYGLVIIIVITLFGLLKGINILVNYFETVFHMKLGKFVLITSNLSQMVLVVTGLIFTLALKNRTAHTYRCIFSKHLKIPQKCMQHTAIVIKKAIIIFLVMICNNISYNLLMSIKHTSETFDLKQALAGIMYYHYMEAYILCSNVYWTHILLVTREYISELKCTLYQNLKLHKILYSKTEKIQMIHLTSDKLFLILDTVDSLSLTYTPQLLAFCGKFVFYSAPVISSLLWNNDGKSNVGVDYIFSWNMYCLLFLKWMVFPYVSFTNQVREMATVIHGLVSTGEVDDLSEELFTFSLAILHRDFNFSACGFFIIDYSLMYQVVRTIVSYLVILAQFQSSSRSMIVVTPANFTASRVLSSVWLNR